MSSYSYARHARPRRAGTPQTLADIQEAFLEAKVNWAAKIADEAEGWFKVGGWYPHKVQVSSSRGQSNPRVYLEVVSQAFGWEAFVELNMGSTPPTVDVSFDPMKGSRRQDKIDLFETLDNIKEASYSFDIAARDKLSDVVSKISLFLSKKTSGL